MQIIGIIIAILIALGIYYIVVNKPISQNGIGSNPPTEQVKQEIKQDSQKINNQLKDIEEKIKHRNEKQNIE